MPVSQLSRTARRTSTSSRGSLPTSRRTTSPCSSLIPSSAICLYITSMFHLAWLSPHSHSRRVVSADPVMIMKQVENESDPRSYSPNCDFLLNTPYIPLIISETVSPKNESDRCRMLLQAMVCVRVGNYLRTSRNLVILCFYLNTKFEAERYLVYQASTDNTNQVCAPALIRRLF